MITLNHPMSGSLVIVNPQFFQPIFLIIKGERLNFGCGLDDIEVRIGKSTCQPTKLTTNQLTCRPPSTKPPHDQEDYYGPDKAPAVTVNRTHASLHTVVRESALWPVYWVSFPQLGQTRDWKRILVVSNVTDGMLRLVPAVRQFRPPIALRTDLSHITTELW